MQLEFVISDEHDIRKVLKKAFSERLYNKIKDRVSLNGKPAVLYIPAEKNDIITVDFDYDESNDNIVPNVDIKLDILYEDEWMLIVNKQARNTCPPYSSLL